MEQHFGNSQGYQDIRISSWGDTLGGFGGQGEVEHPWVIIPVCSMAEGAAPATKNRDKRLSHGEQQLPSWWEGKNGRKSSGKCWNQEIQTGVRITPCVVSEVGQGQLQAEHIQMGFSEFPPGSNSGKSSPTLSPFSEI